jgi:DNA polymerase V
LPPSTFKATDSQYAASKKVSLPVATADTSKLAKAALIALGAIWRPTLNYKKAGIILIDIAPACLVQGDLWDNPDSDRRKALMRAMDRLNAPAATSSRGNAGA